MIRIYINKKVAEGNKANGTDEPSIVIHDTWTDERIHAIDLKVEGLSHVKQDPKSEQGPSTYIVAKGTVFYQLNRGGRVQQIKCRPDR